VSKLIVATPCPNYPAREAGVGTLTQLIHDLADAFPGEDLELICFTNSFPLPVHVVRMLRAAANSEGL